jgi:alcohol dehydrogenase
MINSFSFNLPTRIEFGRGCINVLADIIAENSFKNILFVTDKGVINAGLLSTVQRIVDKEEIKYEVFSDIVVNPRDDDCDKGVDFAKKVNTDVIIAIGGGSAMDAAKAIATVMTNGGKTRDWFDTELDVKSLPVICIPTTCGTGSEVTFNAVITDSKSRLKANIFDPKCVPIAAIVDPSLLDSLPVHMISSTGMDALTHAIEAYVCKVATPLTDAIAFSAIKMIKNSIMKAAKEKDKDALDELMLGSMMAGIAFGNADTAAVHCISECLGGFYDLPHGVTNAIFLAEVSEFSLGGNVKKYKEVAELLGASDSKLSDMEIARAGIELIRKMADELKIPPLSSFENIDEKDFEYLAEASSNHCCNENNPVVGTKEDYLEIFKKVYTKQ